MLLDQKVAVITGASSGIGRAIALRFASEGASVVIDYPGPLEQERAEEVRQLIEQKHGKAIVVQADVSDYQQVTGLIQQAIEHFKGLDILVNNAGVTIRSAFLDITEQQWDHILSVDLKGAFFCAQAAAREMVKRKTGGRIINISSVHENLALPENAPYACAKGGLRMMTRTICLELAPYNITVNNIAPGAIDTPINAEVKSDPAKLAMLLKGIPFHRMGQPEEIAELALYLTSDAAGYITGSTFIVDGGLNRNIGER